MVSSAYLVELDDDVVDAPELGRDPARCVSPAPGVGYLAADLEDDPYDVATDYRYRIRPDEYTEIVVNGVRLLEGPPGGACAMTSRDLYDRVGGFRQDSK